MSTDTRAAIRIDVDTGSRTSAIWIGDGIAEQLSGLLDAHGVGRRRFIVSSPVIWRLHGKQLQQVAGDTEPILIPDGERNKNLQSVSRIYESLIRAGADRGSALVAVGGGVIGDTAGFAVGFGSANGFRQREIGGSVDRWIGNGAYPRPKTQKHFYRRSARSPVERAVDGRTCHVAFRATNGDRTTWRALISQRTGGH